MSDFSARADIAEVLAACARWIDPKVSLAWRLGLMGECLRREGDARLYTDLSELLIPGLAALGIAAQLCPMPLSGEKTFRRAVPFPIFAFSGPVEGALPDPDAPDGEAVETPAQVIAYGHVTGMGKSSEPNIFWEQPGREKASVLADPETSRVMALHQAERKGQRSQNVQTALSRWVAFGEAYPERIPTAGEKDASIRALAAAFLHEIAGRRRDRAAVRWRHAALAWERAEVTQALQHVRTAILVQAQLPFEMYTALETPCERSLSDVARRELIYLARAGTTLLKILAVRRLACDPEQSDIVRTLQQLRFDPHPWVRAAAMPKQ